MSWHLVDVEARNRVAPKTFKIPPIAVRTKLRRGDLAKLMFESDDEVAPDDSPVPGATGERMWVVVEDLDDSGSYVGTLSNAPLFLSGLALHDRLVFDAHHVCDVDRIACIRCGEYTPDYKEEKELEAAGWTTIPHPEDERTQLQICPSCTVKK